jgi:hypothetical protein
MVFSTVVCLPAVWLALSDRFRGNCLVWLVGVVCLGPLIVMVALAGLGAARFEGETVVGIFSFGLGVAGTTVLVLLIVRALGYRLIGPNSEPTACQREQAAAQE